MSKAIAKTPRIYGAYDLKVGGECVLDDDHCHYLLSVMRKNDGDHVRVFNGRDGEFVGSIKKTGKRAASLIIIEKIREFVGVTSRIHLYFAPIKKDRLGFLIEKATELGVTDFHPVLTDHTENRKFKSEKIEKQMIEAAEQCERLDIPTLHDLVLLDGLPNNLIYCALERSDSQLFNPEESDEISFLIGPEGGWSDKEVTHLTSLSHIIPVSLGPRVLRAETSAIFMASRALQGL